MSSFVIKGKKSLNGNVEVSGAKNEVLKLIPLSLILSKPISIDNSPEIEDVKKQLELLRLLGGEYQFEGSQLRLNSQNITNFTLNRELSTKLRASIVYTGPLLSRFKRANIFCPGGCAIGLRSIDSHLDAFRQCGVEISHEANGSYFLEAKKNEGEVSIQMAEKSVTATENIILYLAKSSLVATISNFAREPEVMDLIRIINLAGGRINENSDGFLRIEGVEDLSVERVSALPDRIEAGTFALAIALTGGSGTVSPYIEKDLRSFTKVIRDCNVNISVKDDVAYIEKSDDIKPFVIETAPYPGFPTDLQSPMSLLAAKANGKSIIREKMFDNRLGYLKQLQKMGLKVEMVGPNEAQIFGPTDFVSCNVESPDLRSGITLLIAALMAQGESIIEKAQIIDRGYEKVEQKLNNLGAQIIRREDAV
ncbi:MAG: UDP-N-acetylglucosamine 1-carboxyvinyltransferase 2 [candidate division WS2 bacterium ADurb.Bin280]|uniref:UDP-N-acetylglucosamine 1-carboxyvinyltransferase n=1 Tax=candidate division WS2 bacterium ADurb.Bin280 TaxID=1852829 RepID=A0A1V5SF69_9BACT|nr:MAG: UDP-N-acetylglucosamine 1-carboxyvinyltransferase 2 [candidate division WS2 bacterium ADurb.Bin280]